MVRVKYIIYGTKLMKNVFCEVAREETFNIHLNKLNTFLLLIMSTPYGTDALL